MERTYEKPRLIFQELEFETNLCNCDIQNPTMNVISQCGYEPEDLGFKIFATEWLDCATDSFTDIYCYHTSMMILFGS